MFVFFIPGELLEKISVTKSTHLLEGASRYDLFLFPVIALKIGKKVSNQFRLETAIH